ncbi:MAG: triose-phosphate isomerase, partial [Adlercreutzia sp.]|nr:triose-phosphate isomerase [Adlercreutzia sp.]
MTRKNLIAGNWKMNNTIPEAVVLAQEISNGIYPDILDEVDVAVCPPFVDLKPVKSVFEFDRVNIALG